jgi:hypothetical protein
MNIETLSKYLREFGATKSPEELICEELARAIKPSRPLPSETPEEKSAHFNAAQTYYRNQRVPENELPQLLDETVSRELAQEARKELEAFRAAFLNLLLSGMDPGEARDQAYARAFGGQLKKAA